MGPFGTLFEYIIGMKELLRAQRSIYEVEKTLGDGLTSEVFKAFRKDSEGFTKQEVALKLIKSRKDVQILKKEFESLLQVDSKYCVQVLAWENFNRGPALVLEYIDGVTLQQLWSSGVLLFEDMLEILCQVRLGLTSLHRNQVFHGDLNLKNVMINKKGVVKLIDFGFGFEETQCLTPEFAAPERLAGAPPTRSADWVSFTKLSKYLVGKKSGLDRIHRETPKARRRRQLAKKVMTLCSLNTEKTQRWQKVKAPRRRVAFYLKVCSVLLFFSLLVWPDPGSQKRVFQSLSLRSQKWFRYSVNGSPYRYGPVARQILRKGTYPIFWNNDDRKSFRSINLESDRTFLLNPE